MDETLKTPLRDCTKAIYQDGELTIQGDPETIRKIFHEMTKEEVAGWKAKMPPKFGP